jgi:cytochrome P450
MDREALRNEAATLFMAGHETTANTLAWAWWLLAEDPARAARLREEARAALGGRVPGFDDLRALPFARAVVEETLRLYPPVPFLARQAQEDVVLHGERVPRGSLVLVCPWLLHRHRRHWEAPDAFRPERFLPPNPPPDRALYIPFSFGPRVCTGLHFGLHEAVVALAGLAPRFAPAKLPGHDAFPVARLTTRPGQTLFMRLGRAPA